MWLGHAHRIENNRLACHALEWVLTGRQKKGGRPRKNWRTTIEDGLNVMGNAVGGSR